MTTNPSPTTQHFAAGPHQDWPRLPEGAERYLDSPTAGTLPADIPGGRHPILDALELHPVNGTRATDPVPTGFEVLYLAAGCFWGVERIFWRQEGVWATAVGYMGGGNANPTYREVCTGRTGHAETVAVAYDPSVTGEGGASLIKTFFENHDSTRPNRHGNDVG
ncbi:MAG: peptide-methionine (S)-S-oxide reductase, partial [Trueperella pyogenes]|nr:peptide-methionine (S)-S-oxide reductase [Trueperella pyogenes]